MDDSKAVGVRIPRDELTKVEAAANLEGKSRSAFVAEAAARCAADSIRARVEHDEDVSQEGERGG